jgi:hypothetical protein
MSLWCLMEWNNAEADAKQFRFSAALLASRYYWLSQGGESAEVVLELEKIASMLLPSQDRDQLFGIWGTWVRDGQALETLSDALNAKSQGELAALCTRNELSADELVWQTGHGFCSVAASCDKTINKTAYLVPLDQTSVVHVKTAFIAPLIDLLKADLGVSDNVKSQVFSLINAVG